MEEKKGKDGWFGNFFHPSILPDKKKYVEQKEYKHPQRRWISNSNWYYLRNYTIFKAKYAIEKC